MGQEIASLFAKIGGDTRELEKSLKRSETMLAATGKKMAKLGKSLTMKLTLPILAVGAGVLKLASDFDQGMRNVNSVLQLTEDEFQSMKQDVLDFSVTTRSSSKEVAEALLLVAQAGFRGEEAFMVMESASRAAGAAFTDAGSMARLLSGAINSFGLEAKDAARLNDLFISAMQKGGGSVGQMATSMGTLFPVAASANIALEDLLATTTLLVRGGFATSEAVVSIRQAILGIIKPSENLAALFKDLGFASGQAALDSLGFAGVMQLLERETGGSSEALAGLFGNIRALNTIWKVAGGQADELADSVANFGAEAEGALERAKIQQYQSLETNIKRLKGSFEVLGTTIGTILLPAFNDLIESAIEPVRKLTSNLSEDTVILITKILLLTAAVGPAVFILGKLAMAFSFVAGAAKGLLGLIIAIPALIGNIGAAFALLKGGAGIMGVLSASTVGLMSPLTAVVLAIAAVAAAWKHVADVMSANERGAEKVGDAWTDAFNRFSAEGLSAAEIADKIAEGMNKIENEIADASAIVKLFIDDAEDFAPAMETIERVVFEAAASFEEYKLALESTGFAIEGVTKDQFEIDKALAIAQQAYQDSADGVDLYTKAMADGTVTTEEWEAIMAQATGTVEGLSDELFSFGDISGLAADAFDKMGVGAEQTASRIDNLAVAMGETTNEQLIMLDDMNLLSEAWAAGVISLDEYTQSMQQAQLGVLDLSSTERVALADQVAHSQSVRENAAAARDAALGFLELSAALKDVTKTEFAKIALDELTSAYDDGRISFDDYVAAFSGTQEAFGFVDADSIALAESLGILFEALETGILPAASFDEALVDIHKSAAEGNIQMQEIIDRYAVFPESSAQAALGIEEGQVRMSEAWKQILTDGESTADRVAVAWTGEDWDVIGESVSSGVAAGIAAGESSVINAAVKVAQNAINAAEATLGIASPSAVFAEIGRQTMEGFAVGIGQGAQDVASALPVAVNETTNINTSESNITNEFKMSLGSTMLGEADIRRILQSLQLVTQDYN